MQTKSGMIFDRPLSTIIFPVMKKNIIYPFIAVAVLIFINSCGPGPDPGPEPTADPRDKFTGNWNCSETSNLNGNSTFQVTISLSSTNTAQILFANFNHLGTTPKIYGVVASNYVEIPAQTVNSLDVRGSGNYNTSDSKIYWNYYIDDGADIDTCQATFTK